ncbi:MAG TPA: hypothetical protein VFR22_01255 [Nocardioidaceae bacterium]|nr:hypothetical protein [Nocardioidaceae bacterium]
MNPRRGCAGWKRDVRAALRRVARRPPVSVAFAWLVGRRGAR